MYDWFLNRHELRDRIIRLRLSSARTRLILRGGEEKVRTPKQTSCGSNNATTERAFQHFNPQSSHKLLWHLETLGTNNNNRQHKSKNQSHLLLFDWRLLRRRRCMRDQEASMDAGKNFLSVALSCSAISALAGKLGPSFLLSGFKAKES